MSIWSNNTISRFAQEAENFIAKEYNCILDRIALATSVGLSIYTLPNYVVGVDRVTWKGKKLDPIPSYELRFHAISSLSASIGVFDSNVFDTVVFDSGVNLLEVPQNEPYEYFYNGFGQNTIKFFPSPNEAIASISSNLWGSEIKNRVIVQFWRVPDFTSSEIFRIPGWYRRNLIKSYTLWKCFSQEGKGQDLGATKYYENKFKIDLAKFRIMLNDMYVARDNSRSDLPSIHRTQMAHLPLDFGTIIGDD